MASPTEIVKETEELYAQQNEHGFGYEFSLMPPDEPMFVEVEEISDVGVIGSGTTIETHMHTSLNLWLEGLCNLAGREIDKTLIDGISTIIFADLVRKAASNSEGESSNG